MDTLDQVSIFDVAKIMELRPVGIQILIGKKKIGLLVGNLFASADSQS